MHITEMYTDGLPDLYPEFSCIHLGSWEESSAAEFGPLLYPGERTFPQWDSLLLKRPRLLGILSLQLSVSSERWISRLMLSDCSAKKGPTSSDADPEPLSFGHLSSCPPFQGPTSIWGFGLLGLGGSIVCWIWQSLTLVEFESPCVILVDDVSGNRMTISLR